MDFHLVAVFSGDLAQCGHMTALKAVHELEKTSKVKIYKKPDWNLMLLLMFFLVHALV